MRYFENLFSRLKLPFILVLDNYQTVPAESNFHEVINQGISTIPDGIQVIVISRQDPPPAFSRLRANGLMKMIDWDDLRLTLEETTGIVPLKAQEIRSKEVIGQLHLAVDGWVAGLILMLESIKRRGAPYLFQKMAPEEIIDYFGNELFNKADKANQDFLLQTAFLPRITIKAAEQLSGHSNAGSILLTLSRNNYFTERYYTAEPVFQYHPLFREFLMARARETFSQEKLLALVHQTAFLLEEDGRIEAAISLYRSLGDWEALVQLILKEAPSILAQGRYRTLEEWLDSLPRDLVEQDPWLLYWKGTSRFPFDPARAQSYLERAFEQFRALGDFVGGLLAWSGVVHSIVYRFEDHLSLDRWIQLFPALPQNPERIIPPEVWIEVVSSMFTAVTYRYPEHGETGVWIRRAESIAADPEIQALRPRFFCNWCITTGLRVTMSSHSWGSGHCKTWHSPKKTHLILIMARLAEAMHFGLTGDDGKCLLAVADGLKTSERTGIYLFDYLLLAHGISCCQDMGDLEMAQNLLEKMASSRGHLSPHMKGIRHFVQARQFLLRSELRAAATEVEFGLRADTEVGAYNGLCLMNLLIAQIMHVSGKDREAWGHLQEAARITRKVNNKVFEYHGLMIEAHFYLDQGEETRGLASLRKALAIGKEKGLLNTFVDQPAVTARLCVKALEEGLEVPYVREIIQKRRLIPKDPPLHLENWPWPIKISTLGRFELLKDGNPVEFPRKIQKKPLLLLKAIIALGGREVNEERLMDILWPEADGDQAYNALTTTLSRLRQLLGEQALEVRAGRVSLNPRFCWVDVWAFEDLPRIAEDSWRGNHSGDGSAKALTLMDKAVDLYQGAFLSDEGSELMCALPLRERLRNRFISLIERLGGSLEQSEQWERAVVVYQKGLRVDYLAEELYRGLMACYGSLGEIVKVVQVYRQLKAALSFRPGSRTLPQDRNPVQDPDIPPKNSQIDCLGSRDMGPKFFTSSIFSLLFGPIRN